LPLPPGTDRNVTKSTQGTSQHSDKGGHLHQGTRGPSCRSGSQSFDMSFAVIAVHTWWSVTTWLKVGVVPAMSNVAAHVGWAKCTSSPCGNLVRRHTTQLHGIHPIRA
jgi:hypothetical protein